MIIDCMPSLGMLTINALTAADSVLIPMEPEYYAADGLMEEVNLDESNGKRLVSEKLDAGYSEYVMGRRYRQTSRFSNQAVTVKRNGKNT